MQIVGLDVCKSSVVACLLTEFPVNPKQFFRTAEFPTFKTKLVGIQALLELKPDIAVMEPSGVHYSKLWAKVLELEGIEVRWVGHLQLRSYRQNLRLPSKNDKADALALACYCWQHLALSEYFLRFSSEPVARLREIYLQLHHLNRVQNPIINRLRQSLAYEFPETAQTRSLRRTSVDVPPLWGWLAQIRPSSYYERTYTKSVARSYGIEISDFTRTHAQRLCSLQLQENQLEAELELLLQAPEYQPYLKVFASFGFGLRTKALLLSQIYPIENYLDASNKPIVEFERGKNGKLQKRHRSLRSFKLRLGLGLVEDSSGDYHQWVPGGSSLCRKALWLWELTRIEPMKIRPKNEIGEQLGAYRDQLRQGGTPAKVVQSRVCVKAVTLLFKKLVEATK